MLRKTLILCFISLIFFIMLPSAVSAHFDKQALSPVDGQVFTGGAQQVEIAGWDYILGPREYIYEFYITIVKVGGVDSPDDLDIAKIRDYPYKFYKTKSLSPGKYSWYISGIFNYLPGEPNFEGHHDETDRRYFTIEEIPAPPTPTPSPTGSKVQSASNILFKANPKKITNGKAVTLSGTLLSNDQPVADKTILIKANALQEKKKKAKGKSISASKPIWKNLAIVKTDKNGKFVFKHRLKQTTIYKAEYAGDSSYQASTSGSVKVIVKKTKKKKRR